DEIAGGIVDQKIGIGLGPVIGARPAITFHEDQCVSVDFTNSVHRRLSSAGPEAGGVVWLVHDVVAVQRRMILGALSQLAPYRGIRLVRHLSRTDQRTLVAT